MTVRASPPASCLCVVGKEKERKRGLLGGSPQSEGSLFPMAPIEHLTIVSEGARTPFPKPLLTKRRGLGAWVLKMR